MIISIFIGLILGIFYGLSFLQQRKEALSFFNNSNSNFIRFSIFLTLRLLILALIFYYLLILVNVNLIIILVSFIISFWAYLNAKFRTF